jgi:membrane protease YdiL (CAAX protease family)
MQEAGDIPKNPFTNIPILLGVFLFSMPLGIFIYLLIKRYKLMKLGLMTKPLIGLLLGLIIWLVTGLCAYIFNREGIIWKEGFEELGGVGGIILQGIIGAALVEEFTRFIIQSRFEKVFKTSGINILFATMIWACMHFPMAYAQGRDITQTCFYCIQIIPIGFVWGFLSQRTKSILPSTIAHGLNLWGLQNG